MASSSSWRLQEKRKHLVCMDCITILTLFCSCRWASWIGVSIIYGLAQDFQRKRIIMEKRNIKVRSVSDGMKGSTGWRAGEVTILR
jgi:hypothetical protein